MLRRAFIRRGVRNVDGILPGAVKQVAPVLHGIAETERITGIGLYLRLHVAHHQVWWRYPQNINCPRLVVVVVKLSRIVWIDVGGQRVFQDHVVAVSPHSHKVFAREDVVGNRDLGAAQVVATNGQVARVGDRAEEYVAFAWVGTRFVHREPDRIGPAVGRSRIAPAGIAAQVADLVVDADAGAVHGLVRGHHLAGHQIGKWDGVDIELDCTSVVGFAGVFINVVVAVGHHDQVSIASESDGDVHRGAVVGITLGWRQGRAVLKAPDQHIIAAKGAIQRQVHAIDPTPGSRLGAHIADGVAHRGTAASNHVVGRRQGTDAQVGTVIQADIHHVS